MVPSAAERRDAAIKNSPTRYGVVTKLLHWAVFLLILNQFVVAVVMLHTPPDETVAGYSQGTLYNWHKSTGIITFVLVLLRFGWRTLTPMPSGPRSSARVNAGPFTW